MAKMRMVDGMLPDSTDGVPGEIRYVWSTCSFAPTNSMNIRNVIENPYVNPRTCLDRSSKPSRVIIIYIDVVVYTSFLLILLLCQR